MPFGSATPDTPPGMPAARARGRSMSMRPRRGLPTAAVAAWGTRAFGCASSARRHSARIARGSYVLNPGATDSGH